MGPKFVFYQISIEMIDHFKHCTRYEDNLQSRRDIILIYVGDQSQNVVRGLQHPIFCILGDKWDIK